MSPARRIEVDQPSDTGLAGLAVSPAGRDLLEAIAAADDDAGNGVALARTDAGTYTVGDGDERAFSRATIDHVADVGLIALDADGDDTYVRLTEAGHLLLAE